MTGLFIALDEYIIDPIEAEALRAQAMEKGYVNISGKQVEEVMRAMIEEEYIIALIEIKQRGVGAKR